MGSRAKTSGISLSAKDAAIAKGMLARGDRQHDVAAWFGVNGGRIAEISTGMRFSRVKAQHDDLPPAGPYPAGKVALEAVTALAAARAALANAEAMIQRSIR
ncbi:hypothetical protein [Rhizobium leguminosarum]|uniref:hypothetical protein n=1 Tax=Rhizobium leguminosarum TaxID=384 RepID=UPI001C95A925|nr:hypothetical protein [Rhizobium leguminosarum]MBY5579527.1 hypothetical protein [Rhizobium leguminosarum]